MRSKGVKENLKETRIVTINPNSPDVQEIRRAASIIRSGGLVAFPTETVYGLGADGLRTDTVNKIFRAKGRPQDNPLILHCASPCDIKQVASEIPQSVDKLIRLFWPGPLTLVLPKKSHVPDIVSGGLSTIGIRMPDNIIALTLIAESGTLLAAPSANLSGRPSPTQASHVIDDMQGRIDLVLDGGPTKLGVESTVLDLTKDPPLVLRPGSVTLEELQAVLGCVEKYVKTSASRSGNKNSPEQVPPSMKYPHYSLNIKIVLVEGRPEPVVKAIRQEALKHRNRGEKVGIMSSVESKEKYLGYADVVRSIGSRYDMTQVASELYGVFRDFETTGINILFAEGFDEAGLGFAVMNRLREASKGRIIYV